MKLKNMKTFEEQLPNGIEVVPLTKSDFDWNKDTEYRRIVNVL
jgi:hypothetical protein